MFPVVIKSGEVFYLFATGFVAVGHHHVRRIIAILLHHPVGFLINKPVDVATYPQGRPVIRPAGTFGLQIDTHAFNEYWKQRDDRRLYTGASVGGSWPVIPNNEFMVRGGARDLDWKNRAPQSVADFSENIKDFQVPFVSHETGQYCVFPNFPEALKKASD